MEAEAHPREGASRLVDWLAREAVLPPSQAAADLLTGPGRAPAEAEVILERFDRVSKYAGSTATAYPAITPATLTFTVLAPFWQRRAFVGAMALLIAGLAYTGYRLRMNQLLALERVRTRIATDLHDDLGGSLTRMIVLSEVVRRQAGASREETVKRTGQIADTARSLVDALSDPVWAIDARSDMLAALVARLRSYASDLFDARRTACIFDAPPDPHDVHLSPDVRRHLFLIVKEALTNVARHAEASRVEVRIARAGRQLTVDVIDNGRGDCLPPRLAPEARRPWRANMQSRAARLKGRVEIDADASGTRVHVAVMLR